MFKKKDLDTLGDILKETDDRDMYLFQTSFRNLCLGQNVDILDVLVVAKQEEVNELKNILNSYENKGFRFSYSPVPPDELTYMYTIDSVHLSVNKLINDLNGDVQAIDDGVKHLIDKELSLTKQGQFAIESHPQILFDSIIMASQLGLSFEINSMKFIFNNRHRIKEVDRSFVFTFLTSLFNNSLKVRKGIAMVNTLGLSIQLFGHNLHECSILNHLNKKDIFEFFTIIFSKFDLNVIDDFLVNKVGFTATNKTHVVNQLKAISEIKNEDDVTARKVLNICGKERLQNIVRLVKLLGYKILSKKIKEQKDSIITKADLSITMSDVLNCFRVEHVEAEKILDMALEKVILNPELNNHSDLLLSIHKDIERIKYG